MAPPANKVDLIDAEALRATYGRDRGDTQRMLRDSQVRLRPVRSTQHLFRFGRAKPILRTEPQQRVARRVGSRRGVENRETHY